MKAAIMPSAGALPVYGDFAEPTAGPGQQVVDLVAAGIHHVTRSVAAGRHYGSAGAYPLVPGLNAVARAADGHLVFTSSAPPPYGTFAERIASPDAMRFPLPDGASPEAVAAGINPGMASWLPLQARLAEAGKLATVLILGVTGLSGFLAAQNARLLGAGRVVGAGRSRPGLDRAAAAGAEPVPLTGDCAADAQALATVLDGDAPGLVLDFVWGSVAETAFAALARSGLGEDAADIKYVQIGALAGAEAAVPSAVLRSRKLTISGSGAGCSPGGRDQGSAPALHPAHRRRLGPGAVPHLPAVRRDVGLDRLGRIRPARGPGPRLSSIVPVVIDPVIDTVAWVKLEHGRILCARPRAKGVFYIPGGKREGAETDLQTLRREIAEELTVTLLPETVQHVCTYQAGQVRMSCYTAEYTGTLAPSSEIDELAWFCYADRSRVPPVDQLLFDDLNASGQLH